jgi:hypothetical protein
MAIRSHEAVCAAPWKEVHERLVRIKVVLAAIVLQMLVGEGSVIAVLRSVMGISPCRRQRFYEWSKPEAVRLYGLPQDAPAVLSGCPALAARC